MIRKDFENNPKLLQLLIDAFEAQNEVILESLADQFDHADLEYHNGTGGAALDALQDALDESTGFNGRIADAARIANGE